MKKSNRRKIGVVCMETIAGLFLIALFLSGPAAISPASAADIWYVSLDGSDTNGGTGWDDAFATIQRGIDAASDGDTVVVAAGTYTGAGNKDLVVGAKGIEVRSVKGPESCIIDLQNDGKGFLLEFSPDTSVVDGFTIINGRAASSTDYGVGIDCWFCATTIRNCIIRNNAGVQWGAGIDIRGATAPPVIANCIFAGNQTTQGGSAVSVYQASARFVHCTFYGNSSFQSVAAVTPTTSFTNCIFWDNTPATLAGAPSVTYSDVEGGYTGTGNIDLDPECVDPDNGDLRLSSGSDCIDAGYDAATGIPERDLDGKPRFIDGDGDLTATADMGAYEYGDICECDFLADLDTDGADLADYITDPGGYDLSLLAGDYGRSDCPTYATPPEVQR
ncbi:MAG: right-handed parallel beta-helix repeat-containing protein [Desulfobacterales bacterium]|nr:MAG: right-handed parallel beta-helix repeat-containing protein [Desulfobacterales bacterium]